MAEGRNEPRNETTLELVSDREVLITRLFNAPARLVFEAWTQPEFVRRWWSPKSHNVNVVSVEADVRVGGKWRYVLQPEGQPPFAFSGEYREIEAPSRLVYTSVFEAFPDAPVLVTVTFDDRAGKTFMTSREVYPSKEALDGAMQSGMEHGLRETLDQLDELVASLG